MHQRLLSPARLSTALLATALQAALAGCVAGVTATPPRGQVVNSPPPPTLVETRSPPPGPQATWVAGYWHWNGATYSWIPGHWEQAPPGMARYGPTYGTSPDGSYLYEPGAFRPGAPTAVPPKANALR